jgi:hypothetical protein
VGKPEIIYSSTLFLYLEKKVKEFKKEILKPKKEFKTKK